MANEYGSAVYGSGKYGAGETPGPQPIITGDYQYVLNIKWGTDWVNEAPGRLVNVPGGTRGRKFYVGRGGKSFERLQPGEFTFVLDNRDRRYDPYNTSSPLYGLIEPGKPVEFNVKYVPTGTNYRPFTGHIKDIRPTSGRNQVQVIVTDDLQWLAEQDVTIPTAYNVTVNQAIEATLNAASYPFARSIAASACPITFFDPQSANALDVIRDLSDAGLGTVFVDSYGRLKYYDRTTTGQPTTNLDQAILKKEITIVQPWDTVRNQITTVANRFGYGPTEEIWRMDEPLGVAAGSTSSFKIEFSQAKVQQPVRGVDYTDWFTWENFVPGVGFLTTHYYFSVTLTNITTTGATVNVSNLETDYLYLGFLTIRGQKLVNKKISFEAIDAASVAKGPRRLRIDSPWLQDRGFAAAYPPLLLAHLKDPSKDPVITLETRPDALGVDLLDRIHLTSTTLGIDDTYDVGHIDYRWIADANGIINGQAFEQIIHLQHVLYSTAAITPQPFFPTLPPVPPPTTPPGTEIPPGSTGTTGRAIDCTQDYPAISGPTGPFSFGGGVIDNSHPTTSMPVGKWFRSIYHPSRTYIDVDAVWESLSSGVWVKDATFDFTGVQAINHLNVVVATGSLNGTKVSDGIRRYIFNNTHPYYIQRLGFALAAPSGGTSFVVGSLVSTHTLAGNSGAFTTVTGLVQDQYYCARGVGSFNFADPYGPQNLCSAFSARLNGAEGSWGEFVGDYIAAPLTIDGAYPFAEFIGGSPRSAQVFFKFINSFLIANGDYPYAFNNTGSMDVEIYNATPGGVDKRVTIRSIKVYNVCDDDTTLVK